MSGLYMCIYIYIILNNICIQLQQEHENLGIQVVPPWSRSNQAKTFIQAVARLCHGFELRLNVAR